MARGGAPWWVAKAPPDQEGGARERASLQPTLPAPCRKRGDVVWAAGARRPAAHVTCDEPGGGR